MVGIKSFKDLDVYQISFSASLNIHKLSNHFPKDEQFSLTSQIRRSSKSIAANIAEGFVKQRQSKQEFKRFLFIAVGSATEVLVWLEYCKELNYLSSEDHARLEQTYIQIQSMLNAFISNIK